MSRNTVRTAVAAAGLLTLALFVPASGVSAQATGWQPYLGCWEPDAEEASGLLCFVPSGSQVEMLTIVDDEIEYREFFEADGQPRAINQDGCIGTESASFSSDRDRIFTSSDVTCDGEVSQSTGIISMNGPDAWIDVRTIDGEDGPEAWVQRYRRVSATVLNDLGYENPDRQPRLGAMPVRSFGELTVADVIEASEAAGEEALKAWLAESGEGVDRLDADDLIALDDAGVDTEIIDVLVAVSYPERFAVGHDDGYQREYYGRRAGRPIWLGGHYDPYYGYGYSSFYGFGRGLGYGYGYPYWGVRYRPVTVIVDRIDRGGRVVNGQGYRRSGNRTPVGRAVPRGTTRIDAGASSRGSGRPAVRRAPTTRSQPPASSSTGRKKAKRRGGSSGGL